MSFTEVMVRITEALCRGGHVNMRVHEAEQVAEFAFQLALAVQKKAHAHSQREMESKLDGEVSPPTESGDIDPRSVELTPEEADIDRRMRAQAPIAQQDVLHSLGAPTMRNMLLDDTGEDEDEGESR